ncbi:MAG: HD domain-containing protein [Nanoarchaeota archaeon]
MNEQLLNKVNELFKDKVYLVGGSVRDILLNKTPNDYDFTTSLSPDEIEAKIREVGKRPYLVGKRFGTVGVKIEGQLIEITTFRSESYTKGNRKPQVEFVTSLSDDLSRRDFTINAMAIKSDGTYIVGKNHSKLIDPFNGQDDLNKYLIKAVGNPTIRFKEDPLRMLRACRFASQLEFKIEEKTFKSIIKNAHHILDVSKERWMMELDKLLLGEYVEVGLTYLFQTGLMKFMLPELTLQYMFDQRTKHHMFHLHAHTTLVVKNSPKDINLRWAALLHDIAKPFIFQDKGDRNIYPMHEVVGGEFVEKISSYLKWSNERRKTVKELVLNHLSDESPLRKYDNMSKVLSLKNNNESLNTDRPI